MSYKNNEGYPAPTEGEAIRRASRMPTHVYNDYCLLKLKREIPVLSMELAEMEQGEAGLGNSTIFDYSTGFARPQSVVGFDQERYDRRKRTYEHKKEQAAAVERWIQNIEDGQTRYGNT